MLPNGSENLDAIDWRPMKKIPDMTTASDEMTICVTRSLQVAATTKEKMGRYVAVSTRTRWMYANGIGCALMS